MLTRFIGNQLAPDLCIICRENKSKRKGETGYQDLITCVTEKGAVKLIEFSKSCPQVEVEFVGLSTLDVIAKEFKYHRECYQWIWNKKVDSSASIEEKDELAVKEDKIRTDCYQNVVEYVQDFIINEGNVVKMQALTTLYEKLQQEKNVTVKGAENRLLKARLVNKFKHALSFFQKGEGKADLVYSDEKPKPKHPTKSKKQCVEEIACMIREEILNFDSPFSTWPPKSEDVSAKNVAIPELLEVLLKNLLSSNPKPESDHLIRAVKSLGQDILYASTNGAFKTVKHTQLGMILKRKTGSKELITYFNRLGHCISYSEVSRLETFIAETESLNREAPAFLPRGIQHEKFITYVFDNCDHNPESLRSLTMHCTNGIMIQRGPNQQVSEVIHEGAAPDGLGTRRSFIPINVTVAPYYTPRDRPNPQLLSDVIMENNLICDMISQNADLIWMFARYQSLQLWNVQKVPGWTGFHFETSNTNMLLPHKVYFLPAINQSPTQNDTVQEVLNQVHKKTQILGQQSADLVFDHAIYAKALEILNNPVNEHLRTIINIRMGGFHACCILLTVFGKRFASAGLRDVIIETGLVGPSSVESVLRGKQYNYGMRIIKIVSEAFFRLKLEAFKDWLEQKNEINLLLQFLESDDMEKLIVTRNPENIQAVASSFSNLQQQLCQFDEDIQENKLGPTAKFWQSFLNMSQLLLDYVKSFRIGDWELQLSSMERMLNWFHAYDHINYARHFTYCFASLQNLAENHPSIYHEFQQGNFTVKRSDGNFNMLPPDQVIEQTINKEQKGPGGIIGFSTSIGCVQRWVLSSHVTASWSEDFKNSIGLDKVENKPKDIGKSRVKLDEQMVQQCYKTIDHWQNPFLPQENLVSLSSGAVASKKIMEDLDAAENIGKASVQKFLKERIVDGTVEFHATIKKKKLSTFDALNKVKTCKVKDEVVTIKSDREIFARLLIIQRNRGVDLQEVLNVKIYDGMVLLHKLPPNLTDVW